MTRVHSSRFAFVPAGSHECGTKEVPSRENHGHSARYFQKTRMKDSARSPKWFKRGGGGEVAPIPPPEGEDQSEHVRQIKHTELDIERAP